MNKMIYIFTWTLITLTFSEGISQGFKFSGMIDSPTPNEKVSFYSVDLDKYEYKKVDDVAVGQDGSFSFNHHTGETGVYEIAYEGNSFRVVFRKGQDIKFLLKLGKNNSELTAIGSAELTDFLKFKDEERTILNLKRDSERFMPLKKLPTCLTLYATSDDWTLSDLSAIKEATYVVLKREPDNLFAEKLIQKLKRFDQISIGSVSSPEVRPFES
jgi:hypothetical protein